jgi:hypothetical protein
VGAAEALRSQVRMANLRYDGIRGTEALYLLLIMGCNRFVIT